MLGTFLLAASGPLTFWLTVMCASMFDVAGTGDKQMIATACKRTISLNIMEFLFVLFTVQTTDFTYRLWTLFFGIFLMDTVQFAIHYAYHHIPFLYKFHKTHHQFKITHATASLYNSYQEVLITSSVVMFLFVIVFRFSALEFAVIRNLGYIGAVIEHCPGFEASAHNIHHKSDGRCNYQQPFFHYWDHVFGTFKQE
jgi:sterol desaturase/sphingolipid hydroxylase (fatty acid hydroxylase superfamily)